MKAVDRKFLFPWPSYFHLSSLGGMVLPEGGKGPADLPREGGFLKRVA
jgi:hypothetical protein